MIRNGIFHQLFLLLLIISLKVTPSVADIVHGDDVIVNGSKCIGFDIMINKVFNDNTFVFTENNLRIFLAASTLAPSATGNSWRL